MTDTRPAVALLFDDTELGGHLRDALQERGARIVHEGAVSGASRELLQQVGADVVVVNLDEGADDALDRLYEALDNDRPRVVFNDAQASRALLGWDRARWARHLAVKVLAMGDIDPPRPEDAREVSMSTLVASPPAAPSPAATVEHVEAVPGERQGSASAEPVLSPDTKAVPQSQAQAQIDVSPIAEPQSDSMFDLDSDLSTHDDIAGLTHTAAAAESESLAIELEALLASGAGADSAASAEMIEDTDAVENEMRESAPVELSAQTGSPPAPGIEATSELEAEPQSEVLPAIEPQVDSMFDTHTDFSLPDDHTDLIHPGTVTESEDLAAELEALLASGDLPDEDDLETSGSGLRFTGEDELLALHDGNFGMLQVDEHHLTDVTVSREEPADFGGTPSTFGVDHLQLSALTDPGLATEPSGAAEPSLAPSPSPTRAPEGWALVDDDAPVESAFKPDPVAFGIEKVSAAEFLAPDVEAVSPDMVPTMSLELVSLEESVAPQAYVHDHEMILDDRGSALSRLVLLGASVDGADSVCTFLAALPASTRLTFLLVQHLGGQSDVALCEKLAGQCALPVQLADNGRHAGFGEVVMVPAGHLVRLRRDGSMELSGAAEDDGSEPSIDATLTMAAGAFGRDALAIVFAGRGNDAVAGAQAIHDRGGQVWVESSSGEHFADMVSGIFAERLVSYSGTSSELAAHLIEVFP